MNATVDPAISLQGVCKRFRFFQLEDLSLRLERGQILGLVGPNGAGKSTTLRILMGLLHRDAGDVDVLGCRMPEEQVRAKLDIGFVSEEMRLFGGATLAWHIGFVRSVVPRWDEDYVRALLNRFHLHPEQRVRALSRGEHTKALLLLALARRPKLLVLDEPTTGLDPVARKEVIAELMDAIRDEERAILFSSHQTDDVEQISDRIAFLDRGRLLDENDKEVFLERWRRLEIELPESTVVPAIPGIVDVVTSGRLATLTVDAYRPDLLSALAQAGACVRDVRRMTLGEIFVATVLDRRRERDA